MRSLDEFNYGINKGIDFMYFNKKLSKEYFKKYLGILLGINNKIPKLYIIKHDSKYF